MIKEADFLAKYRIEKPKYEATGYKWKDLVSIEEDYSCHVSELETQASHIADFIRKIQAVHSLKFRVKDPEHLLTPA